MRYIFFLLLLGALSSGCQATTNQLNIKTKAPNIVMLFVDDMSWNYVGFNGCNRFKTPHIDKLANDGTIFSRAYIASPTCSPSRAALVTGRHPAALRLVRHVEYKDREFSIFGKDPSRFPSRNWLPNNEVTYADGLKQLGYKTAFIGKWHLGPKAYYPKQHGFDMELTSAKGHPGNYRAPFWKDEPEYDKVKKGTYLTDYLTDRSIDYIKDQKGEKPFCLTLFYYSNHKPYQGRPDLVDKHIKEGMHRGEANVAGMVGAVDESVGRIRQAVKDCGLADNTIFIFFSDQGGRGNNAPFRGSKKGGQALYDGGARVPLAIYWPGVSKGGHTVNENVVSTDLFPTIIEMAKGRVEGFKGLDGLSLASLLNKKETTLKRDAIYMYRSYESQYAAVVSGHHKLIAYRDGKNELFDLKNDIGEKKDISNEQKSKTIALRNKLTQWEKSVGVDKIPKKVWP